MNEIEKMLGEDVQEVVVKAKKWFEKINKQPAQAASQRIWNVITQICKK